MKILVTGGAGYIGSCLIKLLGENGHDLVSVDNLSTGHAHAVRCGRFEQLDFGDTSTLSTILRGERFDAVIHLAASISVPESIYNPDKYFLNNVEKSFDLIRLCLREKIKYFIFASSASVYGNTGKEPVGEDSWTLPNSPYGRSKLKIEEELLNIAYSGDMKSISLRLSNVAGAEPDRGIGPLSVKSTHLIKVACEAALEKRESFEVYGTNHDTFDGTAIRDFIHVSDVAKAFEQTLYYLEGGGGSQVLNCGRGEGHSVREVVQRVREISNHAFKIVERARRDGDLSQIRINSQKIQHLTCWRPRYRSLDEIIKTALEWESFSRR